MACSTQFIAITGILILPLASNSTKIALCGEGYEAKALHNSISEPHRHSKEPPGLLQKKEHSRAGKQYQQFSSCAFSGIWFQKPV